MVIDCPIAPAAESFIEITYTDSFICTTCGEQFNIVVWHCSVCDHHWPLQRDECWNCHVGKRPMDATKRADVHAVFGLGPEEPS